MATSVASMVDDRLSRRAQLNARSGVPSLPVLTPVLSSDRHSQLRQWQLPPKPHVTQPGKGVAPDQKAVGTPREKPESHQGESRQLRTAPTPRQDPQATDVALTELIRALRRLSAGEKLDEVSLEKLRTRTDPAAVICAQLVQSIQQLLQEKSAAAASSSAGEAGLADSGGSLEGAQVLQDKQQLAAQVAFLERKIAKLREKVKKRANEGSSSIDAAVSGPAEAVSESEGAGTSKHSREKLIAEIERLRSETAAARTGSPARSADGHTLTVPKEKANKSEKHGPAGDVQTAPEEDVETLRTRTVEMQGRLAALATEKEAAEASADKARRLVASVETRLRSVVSSREAEQAELLEQQRQLQSTLEAQNAKLAELDKASSHSQQQGSLQATLAELQRELTQARATSEKSRGNVGTGSAAPATALPAGGSTVAPAEASLPPGTSGRKNSLGPNLSSERPETSPGLQRSADFSLRKAYEQAIRDHSDAQGLLEEKMRELSQQKGATQARVEELEAEIQQAQDGVQVVLADLEKEHASALEALEQKHRSQLQRASEATEVEEQKQLKAIQEELNAADSNHRRQIEAIRADAETRGAELEAQSAAMDAEIRRAQRHAELVRREREFRGAVWLTVRRATFRSSEMIAFLSDILELPSRRIRIIDDDATPQVDAPVRSSGALPSSTRSVPPDSTGTAGARPEPPGAPVPLKGTRPMHRGRKHTATVDVRGGDENKATAEGTDGYFATWRRGHRSRSPERSGPLAKGAIVAREEADAGSPPSGVAKSNALCADPNLRCVFLEFIEDPMAPAHLSSGFSVAVRLLELVLQGSPRAEPLAVVHAAVARGENVLASAWPGETAGVVERRVRKVQGWLFVITVFLNLEPFILRFAAFDDEEGREFHLHLDEDDVNALAKGASSLRPLEMIEAIVPSLRVINREGRLLLVAVQEVQAPPTMTNEVDPVLAETARLSVKYRQYRRQLMQKQLPVAPPPAQPPPQLLATGVPSKSLRFLPGQEAQALSLMRAESFHETVVATSIWNTVREDVLAVGDRFVLLCVENERSSDSVRLTLQEAGRCQPFQVLLPGGSLCKQQRIFAQFCDLGGVNLHLMVEEIASPSLLVIRVVSASTAVSRSQAATNSTWFGREETTLCITTDDWCVVDQDVLMKCPVGRRQQLLQFLVQMPVGAKVAVEGLNAVSMASQGLKAAAAGARPSELGSRVAYGAGLTCFAQVKAASWAHRQSSWRLLAQGGKRILQAGEKRMHVVRIYQRTDPYDQFMMWAHQIGTCREWEFLVSAEDIVRWLPELAVAVAAVTSGSVEAEEEWDDLVAQELLQRCIFVTISGQEVLSLQYGEGANLASSDLRVLAGTTLNKAVATSEEALRGTLAVPTGSPNLFDHACFELAGKAGARPAGALLPAGGRFADLSKDNVRRDAKERTILHQVNRAFGELELALSIEALPSGRGHLLSARSELSSRQFELTLATRDGACPEKFCVERVCVADKPLVFVLAEASFPHSLHALVRDPCSPASGKEFRCTLRDEDIFAMLPRSHRSLLARCAQELVQFGAVGEQGSGTHGFRDMDCGPLTSLPSVTLEQVDQKAEFVIPVLRVPFSPEETLPSVPDELPILPIGSASFSACGRNFRISLTKARNSEDFTLGIGEVDSGSMHLMQLCDRYSKGVCGDEPPMCLYTEVRELAGVSLLILTLLDAAPRALRVAVIEPTSRHLCQLVVLDAGGGAEVVPLPDLVPSRQQVLDAYLSGFVAAPMTPISMRALPAAAALPAPPGDPSSASAGPTTDATDARKQPKPKASQLIFRTTRKLPSGQPVILSVVRERSDAFFRFHVLMYHPVTAREMKIALVNPLLDKVLNACGLADSNIATVEQVDAKGKEVALHILSYAYVHPDGADIEFRTTAVDARPAAKLR